MDSETMAEGLLHIALGVAEYASKHKLTTARTIPMRGFFILPTGPIELDIAGAVGDWSDFRPGHEKVEVSGLQKAFCWIAEQAREKNPDCFMCVTCGVLAVAQPEYTGAPLTQSEIDKAIEDNKSNPQYGVVLMAENRHCEQRTIVLVHKDQGFNIPEEIEPLNEKFAEILGDWRFGIVATEDTCGHPFAGVLQFAFAKHN